MSPSHLIVDTDIGTDVDDAIALVQIIGSQIKYDVSLTTVYGNVRKRAQIASNYSKLSKFKMDVYAGESKTLSGKEIWTSGLEGTLHENLDSCTFQTDSGVQHIRDLAENLGYPLTVLAIAPLTNIATSFEQTSDSFPYLEQIYFMGGRFGEGKVEHNVASDVVAAKRVLESDLRIDVVGIEITSQLRFTTNILRALNEIGPVGELLFNEIQQWSDFWGRDWIVPHDSVAFLMKSNPEIFEFSKFGSIRVLDDGKTEFFENEFGSKRIVLKMDIERAQSLIIDSIQGVKFRL